MPFKVKKKKKAAVNKTKAKKTKTRRDVAKLPKLHSFGFSDTQSADDP